MAPAPLPPAEQMLLPDALVAADEPMHGEWCSFDPDDLCDPSCDNIRASGFANSCFKEKKKEEDGNFVYSVPMGTISWTNDHSPQDVVLSDSDLQSPRIMFNDMFDEIIEVNTYSSVRRTWNYREEHSPQDDALIDSDILFLGDTFDEITVIGKGNFGAVCKARNKQDKKFYAIKKIMEKLKDAKKRKKAMKEVDIWNFLGTHENLVAKISHWIEGNNLYIQMELCESCLSEKKKHFNYGETKKLLYQVSNALEFIHGRGIVHLDVKPANIYLSNGVYKIGDFGCAASTRSKRTIEGGDDHYMPDEMLEGTYKDLRKVDVFSLGASCCELIKEDEFNPRADVFDLVLPTEFPGEFGNLIKSMMDADPEKRPSLKAIMSHSIFDEFR